MSYGVGHRCGSDPTLLWLWCWPVAIALIGPLAWETPYAMRAAQEMEKRQEKKRQKMMHIGVGTGQPVGLVWPTICFGKYSFTVTWSHLFGCCLGLLSCCNSRVDYL